MRNDDQTLSGQCLTYSHQTMRPPLSKTATRTRADTGTRRQTTSAETLTIMPQSNTLPVRLLPALHGLARCARARQTSDGGRRGGEAWGGRLRPGRNVRRAASTGARRGRVRSRHLQRLAEHRRLVAVDHLTAE